MSERPVASSPEVRRRMLAVRRRDTEAELAVRRVLHRQGLRYRIDQPVLRSRRRRADLVFRAARVVVFVDGCFWHACPKHATRPKINQAWWTAKLAENRQRDRQTDRDLAAAGWSVFRVWEHERPSTAANRIARTVRARLAATAERDAHADYEAPSRAGPGRR